MHPFLKMAFDAGAQQAEEELREKLERARKKRMNLSSGVGWKEQLTAPAKLSS